MVGGGAVEDIVEGARRGDVWKSVMDVDIQTRKEKIGMVVFLFRNKQKLLKISRLFGLKTDFFVGYCLCFFEKSPEHGKNQS